MGAILALLVVISVGLAGERRMALRRRSIRRLYQLGEQLVRCDSAAESLRLLESVVPGLLDVTEVRVYLRDRASRAMLRLEAPGTPGPSSAPVLTPEPDAFRERSVELCFRNRTLIAVPDARRSPLFDPAQAARTPRSMALVPMFVQDDLLGVLSVASANKARSFSEDEHELLQHLANQTAIGIWLLEKKTLQVRAGVGEGLLGAQCRLVAVAAGELRRALASLADLSQSAARRWSGASAESEIRHIAGQAGLAAAVCASLVRFAGLHREPQQPLDLAALLRGMLSRRERDWREKSLQAQGLLCADPVPVSAPAGIVEQLLSSLLHHAEQRIESGGDGSLTVRVTRMASNAQVDISWPVSPPELEKPEAWMEASAPAEEVFSVAVCHALAAALGGRMKLVVAAPADTRLELDFPLAQPGLLDSGGPRRPAARFSTPLTALVLEPDAAARQTLVSSLSELGHRAVPAATADEAIEFARLMDFHIVFCSASLTGTSWLDCLQATRDRIRTFVVLGKGHDLSLDAALPAGAGYVLASPPRMEDLARMLQEAAGRSESAGR